MFRVATLAVLVTACSTEIEVPVEAAKSVPEVATTAEVVTTTAATPAAPPRLRFAATLAVAEDVLAAVNLWHDASGGAYGAEVVVSEDCSAEMDWCFALVPAITDCPLQPQGKVVYGCTYSHETKRIVVSDAAEADIRVSVLAHELGHTQGLVHTADPLEDLMNPGRSHASRVHPCITAEDAALAGFDGPGSCLE